MKRPRRWPDSPQRSLAIVLIGLAACAAPDSDPTVVASPSFEATPKPCPSTYNEMIDCFDVEVPEDYATGAGRRIGLNVAVIPGSAAAEHPHPTFVLAGGPGQAVTDGLESWTPEGREVRDRVFVDQRGTGGSSPLYCDLYGGDPAAALARWLPVDAVERCRQELSSRADLRLYSTTSAAHDLETVRRALGYGQINLHGSSYGTRLAQVYLRMYPELVRAAVLVGVAGVEDLIPLDFATHTQQAFDRLLELCATDADCSDRFPDPAADLERALRRFGSDSVEAAVEAVVETPDEVRVTAPLPRYAFTQALRYLLYGARTARRVPLVLERAAAGDFDEPAQFLLAFRRNFEENLAFGLLLSVTCSEDLPFIDESLARERSTETFLGLDRYREQAEACRVWPVGDVPSDLHEPIRTDVPTLMVSGEIDPATPPGHAEEVTRHFSRRAHLVVPEQSHFGASGAPCMRELIERFLLEPEPESIDASSCLRSIDPPRFVTEE